MERKGEGAAQGGLECPSLEVFKEGLDVTLSLDLIFSGSGIQELMAGSFLPLHMGWGVCGTPQPPPAAHSDQVAVPDPAPLHRHSRACWLCWISPLT